MTRPAEWVVIFYNHRGTAEQWIKEGKNAVTWTRLSCQSFKANAVRLQLHALAYNLANFLRTLALPPEVAQWSMTTLRERLVKIGQDRSPRAVDHLPDGRGDGVACSVPDHPGHHCRAPSVATGPMLKPGSYRACLAVGGRLAPSCRATGQIVRSGHYH